MNTMAGINLSPTPVKKIVCPSCGELMVKIYPWSSIAASGTNIPKCKKCMAKGLKKARAKVAMRSAR